MLNEQNTVPEARARLRLPPLFSKPRAYGLLKIFKLFKDFKTFGRGILQRWQALRREHVR